MFECLSIEHAGSAAAHHDALLFPAVERLTIAARANHDLLVIFLRGIVRTVLVFNNLCDLLLNRIDLLLHDFVLFSLLLLLVAVEVHLLHLFSEGLLVVGLLLLQVGLIEVLKDVGFVQVVVFFCGGLVVFLHAVDVVDEDYFVEALFFFLSNGVLQAVGQGSKRCSFFCLLEHLVFLVFLVLLEGHSIALQELRVDVLQVIHLAVNDFLILLK